MCAEKTRRLEAALGARFSPRVQKSGGKLASLPVLALGRRPRHFFGPSVAQLCHLSAAIRWWSRTSSTPISVFCNANTPTPEVPTPKGMAAVCNLALVDPLLKNITPTLQSLAPLHSAVTANIPTPDEVVEGQYAPLQLRHTIAHLLSPLQKCKIMVESATPSAKCCAVPGSISCSPALGDHPTRPTQFILAPLLREFPTPMYNLSAVAGWTAGGQLVP